jgi:hypothetical protein
LGVCLSRRKADAAIGPSTPASFNVAEETDNTTPTIQAAVQAEYRVNGSNQRADSAIGFGKPTGRNGRQAEARCQLANSGSSSDC